MKLLLDGNRIVSYAAEINFGKYDEDFEKWAMFNEDGSVREYAIDHNYTVGAIESVPDDYEDGKYFFENGKFVLNEEWKPYIPKEERLKILERENEVLKEQNADSIEIEAELLYEISLMQLGLM